MKKTSTTNSYDYGTMNVANETFANRSFTECGLSLGTEARSQFRECVFSNISAKNCSVGFPIFDRCHFENIASNTNGVLIYGAAFRGCAFSGQIKNVAIGFMWEALAGGNSAGYGVRAKRFQAENIEMASDLGFAIDVTKAELEWVGFRGEAIIPYVRCARNQAVILAADKLFEKLVQLGRAQKNRAKSNFYLGTGLPGVRRVIATVNKSALEFLPEIERELRSADIEVTHFGE